MFITFICVALFMALFHATATVAQSPPKAVFAHVMGGNYDSNEWLEDIQLAKDAHIDAFALNFAANSPELIPSLTAAYNAANQLGNFSLFISFDYSGNGPWAGQTVVNTINQFKDEPSQYLVDGKPFVSTFEGPNNAADWGWIKSQVPIYFVPCWTSVGPEFIADNSNTDGGFSWNAWPTGANDMNTEGDSAWMSALGSKPYMMPVSPWFFTDLPSYDKNWLWRGDDLWYDRWQQVLEMDPPMVEIISWNDVGESHNIGPIRQSGVPTDGSWYIDDMPHDDWRRTLPYWIDAYKSGNTTQPTVANDTMSYWYRLTPVEACSDSQGTTGGDTAYEASVNPDNVVQDKIFLDALVTAAADVSVQVGSNSPTSLRALHAGVNHFSVPFNGQTGNVTFTISRNGATVVSGTGPAISTDCPQGGKTNFNAYVGGC
ncbi:MAG: hypothetical protein M1819_005231 [Sarea resinae]|nr:MAG: hypothetical protein M1819_005231 [Sarea resinae]